MLHKSFKPAKCKTSLKLAMSRIKLMKNKKGVQINQMKKDLAQLLDTGQDRTARIRVEHVIREEKMVAAYDLIEIYCELIVARLAIIESQKICPTDLKEAVTSVIFAAPRCSDISELSDIRKHFTKKYGKEFVSAAMELRPDCGVSRLLVEKLSAVAPDVQTKIKVLSDVAKEHNIKWDPTSFEEKESKLPNDLLNGPANFQNASMTNADPSKIQASNINDVHSHKEKQDAPFNFSEQNRKYTLDTQNTASTDTVGVETSSATTHADMRSSGVTSERMETRQPVPRGNNDFSSGRQNWNMEFKDATAAAQAAAESAERAAIAARAAAQFSSRERIAKQYPTGSHMSDIRDETSRVSAPSGSIGEDHSRVSNESSSDDRKPKIPNQETDRSEHNASQKTSERFYGANHDGDTRSSIPTSFRSHNDSIEDEKLVNNFHMADGHFKESLNEDQGPSSPKLPTLERFQESKAELGSGQKGSFESEDVNCFAEEATKKQPSIGSSHSHSSTASDELDVPGHQKFPKRSVVGNPFVVFDQGGLSREATKTSSHVDDESISDDDGGPRFDTGFEHDDEVEAESYLLSPGRGSPTRSLENAHTWTTRTSTSNTVDHVSSQSHLFTETLSFPDHSVKYVEPSETDDHIHANFDDSDGPDSESESELDKSSFSGIKESTSNVHDIFSTNPKPSSTPESTQNLYSTKSRIELNDLVEPESSLYDPEDEEKRPQSLQSSSLEGHESMNNSLNQSNDLDATKQLNFGTLTGGLRHKGILKYPPYTKTAATEASYLSKKSVEESSITAGQTSLQSSLDSGVNRMEDKSPNVSKSISDSDSDDYSDKFPVQSFEKPSKQANTRSQPPVPFFDDDGTDSEEEVPKPASRKVGLGSGLSRRTRASPSVPYSKSHVDPEPEPEPEPETVISRSNEDKKQSRYFHSDEIPDEPRSYAGRFKQEAVETKPRNMVEPESRKPSNLGSETFSGEDLVKKAPSHVHPKLPDYDSIAARLQTNRQ